MITTHDLAERHEQLEARWKARSEADSPSDPALVAFLAGSAPPDQHHLSNPLAPPPTRRWSAAVYAAADEALAVVEMVRARLANV